jgi:hypothetical protein
MRSGFGLFGRIRERFGPNVASRRSPSCRGQPAGGQGLGEVLRAEPMQRDGREVYRLKVLTSDGRVRVMQEDPSDPPEQNQNRDRNSDHDKDRPARGRGKQKESSHSDEDPPQ